MATAIYTVEQFLADTRATIKSKGLPSGLEEIRRHLELLLQNPTLLKAHLGDPLPYPERQTIGYDPETDVHVLVHGRDKAGKSMPHDHGPCWVVYGNYTMKPQVKSEARSVPDSSKIVFVGGAHHSIYGGTLCLLDRAQGTEGDAPLTRLTPEVRFPETEANEEHYYAHPWPLSEEYFRVGWADSTW